MTTEEKPATRLDWRGIVKVADDTPADIVEALDIYFKPFAETGPKCLNCGSDLGGLFGMFTWGLVHGEGFCRKCGWPGRAHHYPKDKDGSELFSLRNVILQYHPDGVTKKDAEQAQETAP